jgi:hypothetical protein
MAGVARSTITRAFRPGGPLYPALVGDRGDASHPAWIGWLADRVGARSIVVSEPGTAITFDALAPLLGVPVREVEAAVRPGGPLHAALIAPHHVSAELFAVLAGTSVFEVLAATRDELAPALTESGRIDISHRDALEYLAARPFRRLPDGDIDLEDVPQGMLAPACIGADIDITNPFALAFEARCIGRVRSADAEVGG